MPTMSATGDGLIRACAQSVVVDIIDLFPVISSVAVAKAAMTRCKARLQAEQPAAH